ncbi:hypothetical protein [Fluviicola sp.]|uniref:hypothetical protein n=1 Tax=Fluviicola sp. TaxID=1917219 RepID=UPI0031CFFDDC
MIHLLTLDIPESKKLPIGFLEIIKKQYHENINSSIYAHFINCEEKAVSELFMDALTDLIEEKSKRLFSFGDPFATCEVVTKNGRIDIVITDRLSEQVILVENKIFHHLNNDLTDYWNHFQCSEDHKIGILLTPYPHKIPDANQETFINITHVEWTQKVKEKGIPFHLSNKYTIYITDFVNTIDQFSTNYTMDEQAKFYFEHAQKILKIQETTAAANTFINNQFELLAGKLGWVSHGNSTDWRNFWDEQNKIHSYITIITSDLMQGHKHIQIILELWDEDKARYLEIEKLLSNHPKYIQNTTRESKGRYMHFIVRDYHLSDQELENLANFIYKNILKDFAELILKIVDNFYSDKDISSWKNNLSSNPSHTKLLTNYKSKN